LKSLFVPTPTETHSFIQCIQEGLNRIDENRNDFDWNLPLPLLIYEEAATIKYLQSVFPINVYIYHIFPSQHWNTLKLQYKYVIGAKYDFHLFHVADEFALISKDMKGKLSFLNHFGCHKCSEWISAKKEEEFVEKHWKKCFKCTCGRAYKEGDVHPVTCNKKAKYKWVPRDKDPFECELGKIQKDKTYLKWNHHADFECIHPDSGGFIVDSCGLYNSDDGKRDKVHRWFGKRALRKFFKYIVKNLQGNLWFFFGARFDAHFMLKHCIEFGIPIIKDRTMAKGSVISVLAIKTNKGMLLIKDLTKFLFGSLRDNCLAFRIDKKYIKKDFDHEKVKTWEDAEKHKMERLKYLKYDVLAQREVYFKFGEVIWEDYKLNISDYMSLAQLAYAACTQQIPPGRLYKLPIKDSKPFREAYYGGRIIMTKKQYLSPYYDMVIDTNTYTHDFFNAIDEYLIYLDKNSLYPTQLFFEKFPCGKATLHSGYSEKVGKAFAENLIKEANETLEYEYWGSKLLQVTMTPPKNIYIAFLMSRDSKGFNQQTLEKIERKWYTGVEIIEAVRLGYELHDIHSYYSFEHSEYLFKEFVDKAWKRRLEAKAEAKELGLDDGGPKDLVHKTILNGSTGKHGQNEIEEKTVIYIGDEEINKLQLNDKSHIVWKEPRTEGILAVFQKEQVVVDSTPFCLPITVWILGYARVCMSKFMRLIKGYTKLENVPYYGDTDSLIVHIRAILGIDKSEFGSGLGQMKNEIPNGKIIGLIVLAPKTYMMLYLHKDTKKDENGEYQFTGYNLYSQMKCKGIPHTGKSFLYHANYEVNAEAKQRALNILDFLKKRKSTEEIYPNVVLKEIFYVTEYHNDDIIVTDRITWKTMLAMSNNEANLICIYGSMIRTLSNAGNIQEMNIHLDYNQRSLMAENWWDKGKRIIREGDEMTYPLGFDDTYDILDLLDEMQMD
jgi:hypothetical protein